MIMCNGVWFDLSVCLIIICQDMVIGIMDSIGFEFEMIFNMILFLFLKKIETVTLWFLRGL